MLCCCGVVGGVGLLACFVSRMRRNQTSGIFPPSEMLIRNSAHVAVVVVAFVVLWVPCRCVDVVLVVACWLALLYE